MSYYEKYVKNYQQTPKGKFTRQRANAKQRGIEWKLSFLEWKEIWDKSGKWELRGNKIGQYCMARILDQGAYEKGNVKIILTSKNSRDAYNTNLRFYVEKSPQLWDKWK